MDSYIDKTVDEKFSKNRMRAMSLLQQESSLQEIVRLIGRDGLSDDDKLKLDVTKSLREDFLQQNAFHETDAFCPMEKQDLMLDTILYFYDKSLEALADGANLDRLEELEVKEKITRLKLIKDENLEEFDQVKEQIDKECKEAVAKGDE